MADVCVGCLGSGRCWVCTATGYASPHDLTGVCPRCRGTGRCSLCQPIPAVAVTPPRAPVDYDEDRRTIVELMGASRSA